MKVVLEDMYSTTVAVPVLTIEVYSRYKQGELLENLPCEIKRGGLAKLGGSHDIEPEHCPRISCFTA
jgi:hypothetical protein